MGEIEEELNEKFDVNIKAKEVDETEANKC